MGKKIQKSALGRGLDSLLQSEPVGSSSISEIELSKIKPNPEQPRRTFDEDSLAELATSIKAIGLVQPITLRRIADSEYLIISGERRWRASQIAGLTSVPAYIRTAEDETLMEMALVENIQREDLNPIEVALAYQKLLEGYHMTHEELGNRIGKKRASISNSLRLLRLPAEVQLGLTQRKLDMGHARALLHLSDPELQIALYAQILEQGLSVRQVEEMAREIEANQTRPKSLPKTKGESSKGKTEFFADLAKHLSSVFKTKVNLRATSRGSGKLTIAFDSEEELERIMLMLESVRH